MDNLIGFLVFIGIAIVSIVGKMQEQKKREQQRQRSHPKTRPEDLPEATRRMLYGDTQVPGPRHQPEPIPMAQPKGTPPSMSNLPEREESVEPVRRLRENMDRVLREEKAQGQAQRGTASTLPQYSEARRDAQHTMREMQRRQKQKEERARQERLKQQRLHQQQRQRQRQLQQQKAAQARRQPVPCDEERRRQPSEQPPAWCPQTEAVFSHNAFRDIRAVRQGIIMQEILGPPKSLRQF